MWSDVKPRDLRQIHRPTGAIVSEADWMFDVTHTTTAEVRSQILGTTQEFHFNPDAPWRSKESL